MTAYQNQAGSIYIGIHRITNNTVRLAGQRRRLSVLVSHWHSSTWHTQLGIFNLAYSTRHRWLTKSAAISCTIIFLLNSLAGLPAYAAGTESVQGITRQILLKAIQLNRFIIHYRLETQKQPKTRRLRYAASQEAGLALLTTYDIMITNQFNKGRKDPLEVSVPTVRKALDCALVGESIALGGSAFELFSNFLKSIKDKKNGFDTKTANNFFFKTLKELDDLFDEREKLVESNANYPAYEMLKTEGQIMRALRDYYVVEYSTFHQEARGFKAYENTFYLLNAATNSVGLASIICGLKSLTVPKYNGTANILFTAAGAIAISAPLMATAAGYAVANRAHHVVLKVLHKEPNVDYALLEASRSRLKELVAAASESSLQSAGDIEDRMALYRTADKGFQETLQAETKQLHHLRKVAVESNFFGPLIGGAVMTQGILGTRAYYKYGRNPTLSSARKSMVLNYAGSIIGLTGFATGLGITAEGLAANAIYDRRLRKKHRRPEDLLEDHLKLLDRVEAQIKAMNQ